MGKIIKNNKEKFRPGRLNFHIQWPYIGFAYLGKDLHKRQKAVALAGGPVMSLLLALLFGVIALMDSQSESVLCQAGQQHLISYSSL